MTGWVVVAAGYVLAGAVWLALVLWAGRSSRP